MADFRCILKPIIHGELLYFEKPVSPVLDEAIHLGGLFNSFYPYDWQKITGSRSFNLKIKGTISHARVTVFLHIPTKGAVAITSVTLAGSQTQLDLDIAKFSPRPGHRLTCQIESLENFDLESVSWSAETEIQKSVNLGIIICTHNNEQRLKRNVERLVSSELWNRESPTLIVVNNGTLNDQSWFPEERFCKFDQQNLGGSGGFGRGIYEVVHGSLSDMGISHVLLMDDDVEFYPEIISRAIAFHRKSSQPVVIGGSMLKLEDPTWLHEAGGNVNATTRIGTSTDIPTGPIENTHALGYLGRAAQYDYNAWWFCSFPVSAVDKVGMPLPIFIHGDDIEYGIRLKAHGCKVFCPGGIALWHDSFENKHLTWIRYFDFRNALIRLTLHHDNPPKVLLTQLNRLCQRALIRNDYGSYIMSIKAFEDFCKGPKILSHTDFSAQIKSLDDLYHDFANSDSSGRYRFSNAELICQKERKFKTSLRYIVANLHSIPIPSFRHFATNNTRFPWTDVPYFSDITVNLADGQQIHYRRDLSKCKSLNKRKRNALKANTKLLPTVMAEWRKEFSSLCSESFWSSYGR